MKLHPYKCINVLGLQHNMVKSVGSSELRADKFK